jgi:hypothetical protein
MHNQPFAIHAATTDETLHQRTANLGEKIRQENGVQNAVNWINQWLNGHF